jgi:predicted ATPase/DNA-binding SARP family transcriptional activator
MMRAPHLGNEAALKHRSIVYLRRGFEMPQLRTYFLGHFRVTRDDKDVIGFESDKMRALLAYLVIEADRPHRREELAALLWPDQLEAAARQSLRQALYVLRQALSHDAARGDSSQAHTLSQSQGDAVKSSGAIENGPLLVTRQTVHLNPASDSSCDVRKFDELLAACKAHKHPQSEYPDPDRCVQCIERLLKATELYGGDFLQGFAVNDSREFEEWMLLEREAHHRQMMQSLERLADYYEGIGEHDRALHFTMWQLRLESWREEAHRQAMRLLSRTGQRSAALAQYEACRRALAEELSIEPARETTALYERIRDSETEHHVEQPLMGNMLLPAASTPLIGREAEVTAVVEQLLREDVRVLTVTGPGGVGKTRVALQAAEDLQGNFPDGVYFVNLAPLTDPSLVAEEIARSLGVKETPGKTAMECLVAQLHGKRLLLLLDNFEQIAEAAPSVAQLVRSTSGVKALVTSRTALGLRGAREFPVPPMSLPDRKQLPALDRLTGYEAIRLFLERATDRKPGFEITKDNAPAIVEICHRLDGLPLAIELAAARIKVLSPQAMLDRLQSRLLLVASKDRDVPTRQQTLRNTIDWSYNLLDDVERILFQRMATFQGGRTLRAIQSVCSGVVVGRSGGGASASISSSSFSSVEELDLLDSVESLISKSLLQQMEGHDEEPRFWMLETIHEYAREKLWESGEEDELRRRHARYFLELVEQAAPHLKQENQARWLDQLEDEHDNIRAAFRWARERGEAGDVEAAEIGLRLAIGLERFWQVRVHLREGLEQTTGVLAIGRPGGATRASALTVAGTLADICGDHDIARSMHEESIAIWRELGDKRSLIGALSALGQDYFSEGDFEKARSYFEEALHIEEDMGVTTDALHNLGIVFYELGDYASAASFLERDLAIQRKIGDTRRAALALANLGLVAFEQGDYALALSRHRESLVIRQTLGAKRGFVYSLEGLAMVYRGLGRPDVAARLWGASQAMRESMGAPVPPNELSRYKREMDLVRDELGDQGFQKAYAEGSAMTSEQAVAQALGERDIRPSGIANYE